MNYRVIKHFGEYQAGAVLTEEQFVNQRRIALLIEQRYIQPVAEPAADEGQTEQRPAQRRGRK
jgi:hypothetical protein